MTDKELFLKYNLFPTSRMEKGPDLDKALFEGSIHWEEPTKRKKLLLLLHANYTCNLNCVYCEHQHLRSEYRNAVMPEETVREIVQKLGPVLSEVTWHGGEPLMLPDSMFEALEDEKAKCGYKFRTTLQTNSVALTRERAAFLDSLGIQYGTSFDGLNNDVSRGHKSTEAILRRLQEEPNRVGFIAVTYNDTIDMLIDNYRYFKSLGVGHIQSCIVRENVIANTNPYLVKTDAAIQKMLEYIDYWIHDTDCPIRDTYIVRQIQRVLGTTHCCEDIYCLGRWLIIDPLGNIGHCGHCQQDAGVLNIHDIKDYHELFLNPAYLQMLQKQRKLVRSCVECPWYRVCYGGCMGLNYEADASYQTLNARNCAYITGLLDGICDLIKDIDLERRDLYNPIFLESLREANYYSLTEIKRIEKEYGGG